MEWNGMKTIQIHIDFVCSIRCKKNMFSKWYGIAESKNKRRHGNRIANSKSERHGRTAFVMKPNLLSKIDKEKYTTTKSKLIPHALWTEPFGSGAHDRNILSRIPLFLLTVGVSMSMLVTADVSCWSAILKAIVFNSIQFNQLTVKVIPIPSFLNFRFRVDYCSIFDG